MSQAVFHKPQASGEWPAAPLPSLLDQFVATCCWPTHSVRRIAVLTVGPTDRSLIDAVQALSTAEDVVRIVERAATVNPVPEQRSSNFDAVAPWWEWADVVVTNSDEAAILECIQRGRVPVVGIPRRRRGSLAARRALRTVHPWSSRGLALHLSLDTPARGVLDTAAGLRTARRTSHSDVVWQGA